MEQKPQLCCLMPMLCNFRLTKRRSDQILRHNVSLPNLLLVRSSAEYASHRDRDTDRDRERELADLPKIHNTTSKLFLLASHTALQAKIFARTAKSLQQCKSSHLHSAQESLSIAIKTRLQFQLQRIICRMDFGSIGSK